MHGKDTGDQYEFSSWHLVIALSSDSVFEMFGPLPAGSVDRGYFNFDEPDSPYGGHLKIERLAAIYLLSTNGRNGETHQIAFFDEEGRRVFSVGPTG